MLGDGREDRREAVVVEAGRRLVEQEQRRTVQERHRDPHALTLPHRHAVQAPSRERPEREALDRFLDAFVSLLAGDEGEA